MVPVTADSTDGSTDRPAGTTDRLAAELDRIRASEERASMRGYPREEGDVPKLIAALAKVLDLHKPHAGSEGSWCAGCAIDCSDEDEPAFSSGAWRGWPCPTYLAIARELLGEGRAGG